MAFLQNTQLIHCQSFINNQWVNADSGATFVVYNPANGEVLTQVADCGPAETQRAIAAAESAFPAWRARPAAERSDVLKRWYKLILENADDLAMLMTMEQGKPLAEAKGEVLYGASFIEWFAEEGRRAYGDVIPPYTAGQRILVTKQPIGVVAAITPWNFYDLPKGGSGLGGRLHHGAETVRRDAAFSLGAGGVVITGWRATGRIQCN